MAAQQWVVDGYTLAFASLLLLAGNLSDRLGARRMFTVGVVLFALSSVACMVAPTMNALVAGRVALGIAAAAIMPSSMTLISEAFPDEKERAAALGVWMAGGAIAAAAGPLFGGILTPIHWGLVFAVNVPFCIVVLLLLVAVAPSPKRVVPFDWVGQVLALVGLTCLVGGVIEAGELGIASPLALGLMVICVVALAGFVASRRRVAFPMMPLNLFLSRGLRLALLAGFTFIMSWFSTVFLICLYLQQEVGLTPLAAGLVFLPSAFGAFFGNLISGRLVGRFGAHVPLILGASIELVSLVCLAFFTPVMGQGALAVVLILTGTGGSLMMPAASSIVLSSAPEGQSGVASAVFNTFRQVGASIGIAVFGALVSVLPTFADALLVSFLAISVLLVLVLISVARYVRAS